MFEVRISTTKDQDEPMPLVGCVDVTSIKKYETFSPVSDYMVFVVDVRRRLITLPPVECPYESRAGS